MIFDFSRRGYHGGYQPPFRPIKKPPERPRDEGSGGFSCGVGRGRIGDNGVFSLILTFLFASCLQEKSTYSGKSV